MFEIIVFLGISIVIGRIFDHMKYRVATIAHAVLFVLLSLIFFFGTDASVIAYSARGLVGEEVYETIHGFVLQYQHGISYGLSLLVVADLIVVLTVLLVTIAAFVQGIVQLKKWSSRIALSPRQEPHLPC